jgi:predicted DNA-binding transcriptional regulator AlpA
MTTDSHLAVISPFVHVAEAVTMTKCARSTLIKYSTLGKFPPMVRLLGNRIAFVRADVQNWIDKRVTSTQEAAWKVETVREWLDSRV